jgi:hypothetical protein
MKQIPGTEANDLNATTVSTENDVVSVEVESAPPHSGDDDRVDGESTQLTFEEHKERLRLERLVERAFYEAGKALGELRAKRLYRCDYRTFEEYCRERFSFTHRHVNYLIAASVVVDNLLAGTNGSQIPVRNETGTNDSYILPTSERQVRPLIGLEPEKQLEAWQTSVKKAGGKVPSGRIVKDIVDRIRERTKVPNPFRVGEVCQIIPKDNPELRGKSGCWCIVSYVGDYSCTVTTWDNEYVVKLEHLKSFEYLEEECAYMEELCARLKKLHQLGNLDVGAYWVLNGLGKLSAPYLTPLQEKLLAVLELEYQVK